MSRKAVLIIILIVLLASMPSLVFAAKFNLGDTVEVFNTGASGLVVRDAPAGNAIGKKYDGNRGMILAGPQSASLGGVVYTWWKVRWGDDALEGWSAEGYPGGVDYLKKVTVSPSTKFSVGNLVKVSTGGPTLIVRTDPPPSSDLSYKGSVADGTVGKVVGGPFYGIAQGVSGFYHFWKVDFLSISGWSAENWLTNIGGPTITSSLVLTQSPPYYVGNTITARFTITNRATAPFTFDVLTVGGRDPDNQVADFSWIRSITLSIGASYSYQGTLTLTKAGNYHFFCTYRTLWGDWNPNISTEGGATNTLDIYVPPPPPQFGFTVGVNPSSGSVQQGGSVSATVTVTLTSGSTQTVTLTASGLPSGAYATFSPSSGYPTFTSTCTISTSTITPSETFYITIIGSGGGLTRTTTYTLTVTQLPVPDFSISASPSSLTIQQGNYGSSTITIASINGFNQPVQLSVSGAPSGVTATLSPSQVTPPGGGTATSTLTVSVATTATPGSYTLTVTGTSGALTHSTYVSLEITVAPPPPNQPPSNPTGVSQYRSDGVTAISEERTTPESTVVFKATLSDPDGDSVRLEIELRQIGEPFTGEPTPETISDFVLSGSQMSITRYGLVDGSYKWQYRAKDSWGATSSWVEFGTQGNIDFIVSEDIYWLAKVIASEAGSVYDNSLGKWVQCSDEERISVGWTVLNRLSSGRFQNSIKAIVTSGTYAYNQEPTKEIENLAKKLLEGEIPDPTNGATHFFSPIKWETHPDPRIYGPYKISGTDESVFIPYWVIPIGYSEASPPPSDWEITPFYKTIDFPTTEWVNGITNVRNRYFMFYRPYITRIRAEKGSPVELRVYDSQGRVTGLVNGTVVIEILGSDYFENTVTIFFPNDTYRYEVVGTSEGLYGLTVTAVTRQENITFSAIDIPVPVEAIHQYNIDWAGWVALSQGKEGVTVMVDSDSDGVFEHTFASDSELTQSEFLTQITHYTFSIVWGKETFIVSVESNSTLSNFAFNQPSKEISFNVTGDVGTIGFCNVTIPKALLYGEPWVVLIDGAPVPATITENATHASLYFTYTHSTHTIQIIGTWVIAPPPPPTYSLTITTTVGGTTNPAPGAYSYTANLTLQVTAIPDPNYLFDHWELGTANVGSANPYTVLMDNNHTLKAVFTYSPPPPPLSASISPLSASIHVGQSVTFTSTVSGGYTPYSYQWYLNGAPVSGATSNTWVFTTTASGIYYVYLKVTDAKGNIAQSETARIAVTSVPVGGYSIPIQARTTAKPLTPYLILTAILTIAFTTIKRKTTKKTKQQ